MKRASWIVTCAVIFVTQPAWAARLPIYDMAESPQYGRKAGGMIGRGALNAVTCFVDPLVNIVNETKAGPPFIGTLTGVAKGLGCGVLRLGSGAIDLVTFWVPGFNGFPVSESYENCMAPGTASYATPVQEPPSMSGSNQSASQWDVPTTEPGAAQAPVPVQSEPEKPAKHRTWKK